MGVQDCQKLVNYLYSRYFKKYSRFRDDLISSGYIGFYKALKKYDADKSVKFSTFASACIVNEMRFFIRKEMKHYNDRIENIEVVQEIVGEETKTRLSEVEIKLEDLESEILHKVYQGYHLKEIAEEKGVSKQYMTKKLRGIRNKYKECEERELQI